jgi:phage terminase small subunit
VPVLSNARHERFAQELAKGRSQTEAYELAGYTGDRTAASRLSTNGNIKARVQEIVGRVAERTEITLETLIGYAEEARRLALRIEQPSAVVAAVKEIGVLAGLRVEKSERKNTTDVRELTDEELNVALAGTLAGNEASALH